MTKENNALAIFSRGAQMLSEATTVQQAKELKDLGITAREWAKRKGMGEEAVAHARAFALDAELQMARLLKASDRNKGGRTGTHRVPVKDDPPTLEELGITKKESAAANKLLDLPKQVYQKVRSGLMTRAAAHRETKRAKAKASLESTKAKKAKKAAGVYDVVVIDPPWPMKKIERDCRPNQSEMDYPTMDEDELRKLKIPTASDAHVWLWTTHKFLPMALRLLEAWKLKYVCTFVWHKPGGFQPVGLPQYNCEFALYARKGSPLLLDTKNLPLCFQAARGKHSEKPEDFYDTVRRVTGGRRLDMFNRRKIEGFDGWGKEAPQ